MVNYIPALSPLDLGEFQEHCEKDAEEFETKFIALFGSDSKADCPKVPVFDFAPTV